MRIKAIVIIAKVMIATITRKASLVILILAIQAIKVNLRGLTINVLLISQSVYKKIPPFKLLKTLIFINIIKCFFQTITTSVPCQCQRNGLRLLKTSIKIAKRGKSISNNSININTNKCNF